MSKDDLPLGSVFVGQENHAQLPEEGTTLLKWLTDVSLKRVRETLSAAELNQVKTNPQLQDRVLNLITATLVDQNKLFVSGGRQAFIDSKNTKEVWGERIFNNLYGLGELEALLEDDAIEDIAVNGPNEVIVRTFSGWQEVSLDLAADSDQLLWRVNQVIAFSGRQAGPLTPIVDVQLPSGHRLNVITDPLTNPWPVMVIRRHREISWTLDDFVGQPVQTQGRPASHEIPAYAADETEGSLITAAVATYLHMAVVAGLNILVIGRTGVGKTSMLSALGRLIPGDRRILVLEDTRELKLRGDGTKPQNCVYLVTREKLLEGGIDIDMRRLIITALRQRPDHLILGEARGAEIYDLLNAMQTGHGGNLTSIHANSLADLGQRVNAMLYQAGVEMDGNRSARLIGTSFHIGITLLQDFNGRRYVAEVGEFTGGVSQGMAEMNSVFEGGPEAGYRLSLAAEASAHEHLFQRSGLSFDQVKKVEQGEST
jgi:pilus assembly protein CpaF